MLSIFKSKRNWWRDEAAKLFEVYISSLKGLDAEEIGAVLDLAVQGRNTLFQYAALNNDMFTLQALADPISLPEDKGLTLLEVWHRQMKSSSDPANVALAGALTIWWLSLAGGIFAELRMRGREMWDVLARGFAHSETFSPYDDIPRGVGEIPSGAKTRMALKDQFDVGAITAEEYLASLEAENTALRAEIERKRNR
jgi:hypothetical protein